MLKAAVRAGVEFVGRPVDALAGHDLADVVVLIYHRVGGRSPSPVDLPTEVFAEQLDRLVATASVVDLDTALRQLGDSSVADRDRPTVVLTFDDGTADWVDVVLPELATRGLPATFYVATDFVERERSFPDEGTPISWSGLAELASSGLATVGSHTHTHRVLAGTSADAAEGEISRSVGLVEDRLALACTHFAYPKAVPPSPAAEVVVRRRFASAVLAGNRPNAGGVDRYRLGRHAITTADDSSAFDRKVHGGARLEGWLRERRDARASGDGYGPVH